MNLGKYYDEQAATQMGHKAEPAAPIIAQVGEMLSRANAAADALEAFRDRVLGSQPTAALSAGSQSVREPTLAENIRNVDAALSRIERIESSLNSAF